MTTTVEEVAATFESCGATPEGAHDQCVTESERFHGWLLDHGIEAHVVNGFQFGTFMGKVVVTDGHTAVQVGHVVYDWTARQFDPAAPFPLVQPVSEWRKTWRSLAL